MDYQKPAEGILVQNDYGDSKYYRIVCNCHDSTHDITLEVEADETGVSVNHYVNVKTDWWTSPTKFYWLNAFLHRVKLTYYVWIKGYLEYEASTMLTKQQAFNYAYTLNQAIKDVEEFQKKSRKKS